MVQVYCEGLYKRHFAPVLSLAVILRIVLMVAAVLLSLAIAISTGGFWPKLASDIEQPTVRWSGEGLALLEGASVGQEQVWTTSPHVQTVLGTGKLVSATVQVGEVDDNHDDKPDVLRFITRISSSAPVHSFKLLLQLRYTMRSATNLDMLSLVYISASSPLPGASYTTQGQLLLQASGPLARNNPLLVYNRSLLKGPTVKEQAVQLDAALELDSILEAYAARNVTTLFTNDYPVWKAGSGGSFVIDATIRIPPSQVVVYRPALGEMLKWGWVQFLATFAAVWWVASRGERWVFHNRLLDTRAYLDVAPKGQKF